MERSMTLEEPVLASLTENPCRMCMPMGAALAMKGIEGAMMILHGSQGCATYIRRHMAGHFHEPVDIASTSLSEEGTVYGGEKNLVAGLENVTKLYAPALIGVATTCLAETIGEDTGRILTAYQSDHPGTPVLVPIRTPGYGGTQEDGWYAVLLSLVSALAGEEKGDSQRVGRVLDTEAGDSQQGEPSFINVILPPLNPGDVRGVKRLLDGMELPYVLLPDLSETLDAGWTKDWSRIPEGGTPVADIRRMHRAQCTIELGSGGRDTLTAGKWLELRYGVPLTRLDVPTGVRATDQFLDALSLASGLPVPSFFRKERQRLLDTLVDSHKHLAEAHVCITGGAEFCLSTTRLLAEAGVHISAVATGGGAAHFEEAVRCILKDCGADADENTLIFRDIDFKSLLDALRIREVNLLVGGSDARFLENKLGIPLIRLGFPVHDRMGAQRMCVVGYEGAGHLLDPVANEMLSRKNSDFRVRARQYLPESSIRKAVLRVTPSKKIPPWLLPNRRPDKDHVEMKKDLIERTRKHPCYTEGACANARVHLPVAPKCNISCNYCSRKYDCVNESRPGVTSAVLSPAQAIAKFRELKERIPNLTVVGIAGPGDALANFEQTSETLRGIRALDAEVTFCLSTNGLMLPFHAYELFRLGVTHLTVTVNAVDPAIGARIYKSVNDNGMVFTGEAGAALLLERQKIGIRLAAALGIVIKVNSVLISGVNDHHLPEVVRAVRDLGASLSNIMPLIPAQGSAFEHFPQTSRVELDRLRSACGVDLAQMTHCKQCRADAVGTLEEDRSLDLMGKPGLQASPSPAGSKQEAVQWLAAVATLGGIRVDRHFGQVEAFHIYRVSGNKVSLHETRELGRYCHGPECDAAEGGSSEGGASEETERSPMPTGDRTHRAVKALADCRMVLAMRVGETPKQALESAGIEVVQSCDHIETAILEAAGLGKRTDGGRSHA